MSADNWTYCPECTKSSRVAAAKMQRKLEEAYGNIPLQEWLELKRKVPDDLDDSENKHTLREDYEFYGAASGILNISYHCSCNDCDFKFKYHKKINMTTNEEVP